MGTPVTDSGPAPAAPGRRVGRRAAPAWRWPLPWVAVRAVAAGAIAVAPWLIAVAYPAATSAAPPPATPCLAGGNNGFLRARLRGTLDLDLAWASPGLQCEGGARPDGHGLRVTLAGPLQSDGRRLRFVFGIDNAPEGARVLARPTNLTVIFEGEQRLFATRGNDRCTTDELRPERIGALGGPRRSWRVVARGFCISPATTLDGDARLLVTSFDFASEVTYEDEPAPAPAPARPAPAPAAR
jgi:hypothetical protein